MIHNDTYGYILFHTDLIIRFCVTVELFQRSLAVSQAVSGRSKRQWLAVNDGNLAGFVKDD
jgi:hypothetical protein